MSQRRSVLLQAALGVVADGGVKALTHRAVDRAAGLPLGSTANLFSTGEALLAAVIEEFERQDLELLNRVSAALPPATVAELVDALTEFAVLTTSGPAARLTRARLALFLARPDAMAPGHQRVRALLRDMLASLRVPDPGPAAARITAYLDGLALHAVTVPRLAPMQRSQIRTALALLLATSH